MNRKYIALLLVLVLSLGVLTGCGDKAKSAAPKPGEEPSGEEVNSEDLAEEQKFVFSNRSAVIGLNPLQHNSEPDYGAKVIIMESLVRVVANEEGGQSIDPGVAKDWTISEDGKTYTFNLRDDAKWNDGEPVTAQDFEYTFRMMADPKVAATNAWLFDGIIENFAQSLYNDGENPEYDKNPEDIGVVALDEHTVEFTLTKPFTPFLELLNRAMPVRQDKYEEWGDTYGSSIDKVLMNGPFIATSWDQGVQMSFEKNQNYWNKDEVKLDKMERKVIEEPGTATQALLGGELDVVGTSEPEWQTMIATEGDKFVEKDIQGNAPEFYGLNCSNKYLKNVKIRQALSIALDREGYIEDLNNGLGEVLYSVVPNAVDIGGVPYHEVVGERNQIVKKLQEENPDPKALLIEGLKEEGLDPDPSKVKLRYATRGTAEYSKKAAEWLAQNWKETLGINIEIDMMEWNIMWDKIDEGDYDICTAGWTPDFNDPSGLINLYEPKEGYFNSPKSGWTGPDADKFSELINKASKTVDDVERANLLVEAEEILVGTGVIIPAYAGVGKLYVANYVKNYYLNPHSPLDFTKIYIQGR